VSDDVEPLLLQRLTENAATEQAMDGYLVAFRAMLMAEGLDHDFGPAYVHTVNHMCNAHPTPYLLTDSIQATVVQPTRSYLHERQRHGIHAAGRISDFLGSRALIQWLEAIATAKLVPVYLLILCRIRPGFTQR